MLPPLTCCRDRDLPDPCQQFQASSSTILLPCPHRGRREPRMHLSYRQASSEDFQHQETTRFPSRNTCLGTGPETSLPAGTRERQLFWLHVHTFILVVTEWTQPAPPLLPGHRSRTRSRSSTAATAESCRDRTHIAEP